MLMLPQADGHHRQRSNGARCFRRSLDKSICGNLLEQAKKVVAGTDL
jgi:hypothetical protein